MRKSIVRGLRGLASATAVLVALAAVNIAPANAEVFTSENQRGANETSTNALNSLYEVQTSQAAVSAQSEQFNELEAELDLDLRATNDALDIDVSGEGLESNIVVEHDENAPIDELVQSISVDGVVDGEVVSAELNVLEFTYFGDEDFHAVVEDVATGETIVVSSTDVAQQAFPVAWVLAQLARIGIQALIKWVGKTQVKKAVKSYLLNNIGANKWAHIMAPKHKWGSVGAKSREQVADLMGRAMAEGKHSAYKSGAMQAVYNYKGKTIVVTYSKNGGQVSNGWVR